MDSLRAAALGMAARGSPFKVFDWDEAARRIVDSGAQEAGAGLSGDWEWTGGDILHKGVPLPVGRTYTYLSSTWATPELTLDNGAPQDCWIWKNDSPGWDSDTYWPESALKILNAAVGDVVPPEIESA